MTLSAAFIPSITRAAQRQAHGASVSAMHAASLVNHASQAVVTSSQSIESEAVASTSFEPVLPSTPALIGMGAVIGLCVIAAIVWSEQVVPVSRTKLALSKKNGQVREYLNDLQEKREEKPLETWLFNDWLQARNSSSKKEPALPILKNAKWNSGDNPVVVTSAMIMVGVLVAAITERVMT
jgi:hypothetical protein